MNSYVVFRKRAWRDSAELERAASRSIRIGLEEMADRVRWIRSYVCEEEDGTLGSVCIFQAVDREAIIEHAQRARLACDAVLPISRTVIVTDDLTP